jgi:uncharacterized protein DUF4189
MKHAAVVLFFVLALGLKSSHSNALVAQSVGFCLYECEGSLCYDYGNHSDMCTDIRAKCQTKCSGMKSWGAIAYSAKDKGFGFSDGWNDLERAKKVAMDNCRKHGAECKLWAWFDHSCGAIAADGATVTWGTAAAKVVAEQRAMLECKKAGAKKCAVEVSVCSR